MKHFFFILLFSLSVIQFGVAQNKNKTTDSVKINDFSRTTFNSRSEEELYTIEYLRYKLPILLTQKYLTKMIKTREEFMRKGDTLTLEVAAKRSAEYKIWYDKIRSYISKEPISFKEVKEQLEKKGRMDFEAKPKPPTYIGSGQGSGTGNGGRGVSRSSKFNNRMTYLMPIPEMLCKEKGRVVLTVAVDREGKVVEAKVADETDNKSECLTQPSIKAALKTTFNPNENAEERETGSIIYVFK